MHTTQNTSIHESNTRFHKIGFIYLDKIIETHATLNSNKKKKKKIIERERDWKKMTVNCPIQQATPATRHLNSIPV